MAVGKFIRAGVMRVVGRPHRVVLRQCRDRLHEAVRFSISCRRMEREAHPAGLF